MNNGIKTLYEFNALTLKEKQAVWDKGVFLDNCITPTERLNCYAIDKFFEMVCKPEHNTITETRSFNTGHLLG